MTAAPWGIPPGFRDGMNLCTFPETIRCFDSHITRQILQGEQFVPDLSLVQRAGARLDLRYSALLRQPGYGPGQREFVRNPPSAVPVCVLDGYLRCHDTSHVRPP